MRIEIIRGTVVESVVVAAGEIVDVDNRTAELLVIFGKARVYTEPVVTDEEKAQMLENPSVANETAIKAAPEKRKQ